ncbi:MAG TPA: flagellar motor switch protein FliM [Terriglobales bacterium]|nr:flagellar motor switch protein FliM [Terriglobales bacterium]
MEKVLNQQEIDAMVLAARSGGAAELQAATQPVVEHWDVRRAGQIGREQLQTITALHEGFARSLTHSLGAYLRTSFTAALVSAEHLSYREFLQRVPETTYLASCKLEPVGVNCALQLDLKVALPIIDLLLGGKGNAIAATRDITEIEEQILESVARIVCRELGTAWQALSLQVSFEERLQAAEAQRLMPPEEKTLSLNFEITMPEVRGGLYLAVPAAVSNALLRKISIGWSHRRPQGQSDARMRLMRRMLDCRFSVELGATDMRTAVAELAALAPGKLLLFPRSAAEPASLLIAGVEMFHAVPARCARARAARVLQPMADAGNSGNLPAQPNSTPAGPPQPAVSPENSRP